MSKSQVEVLLSSFPRYIDAGTQHTTVESDTVRYVYQPLEELYMVLITTKQSNILQDIETLHLFAQVVSSICRSNLSEQEIGRNAFELLSAFDEIVCLGYRENLTLPQVRSILDMESHEEKIQEIIARVRFFGSMGAYDRIKNRRLAKSENGRHDSWKCKDVKWLNLDRGRATRAHFLQILGQGTNPLEPRLLTWLLPLITIITRQTQPKGMLLLITNLKLVLQAP